MFVGKTRRREEGQGEWRARRGWGALAQPCMRPTRGREGNTDIQRPACGPRGVGGVQNGMNRCI